MINLDEILTFTEAAEKWGLSNGASIRKAVERDKFKVEEVKKSGNVWLTTYEAMRRVFGEPKLKGESFKISYEELSLLLFDLFDKKNEKEALKRVDEILKGGSRTLEGEGYIKVVMKNKDEDRIICIIKDKVELKEWLIRMQNYMGLKKVFNEYLE